MKEIRVPGEIVKNIYTECTR